jgi:hypothetical protein
LREIPEKGKVRIAALSFLIENMVGDAESRRDAAR